MVAKTPKVPIERSQSVDTFLQAAQKHPLKPSESSRLIFALDATASREPMWDLASSLHAQLFNTAKSADLSVQLVHFGGFNEFRASAWNSSPSQLLNHMQRVRCLGGMTQIGRVLTHIGKEAQASEKLKAAVYIGDMCEEPMAELASMAGQLGLRQVPVFVFQEGHEPYARQVFNAIATRSGGAHMPFDPGSASQLADLLKTVVVYATQGMGAAQRLSSSVSRKLLTQMQHK